MINNYRRLIRNMVDKVENSIFIKCNECKIKPATTRCFDCKSYGQSIARFCYACDSAIHNKFGQTPHKREIIPYKEMYLRSSAQASDYQIKSGF